MAPALGRSFPSRWFPLGGPGAVIHDQHRTRRGLDDCTRHAPENRARGGGDPMGCVVRATGDAFGRSSLLCADAAGEYALETLGVFSRGEVVALHAVVRDPADRTRVEQSFDAMKVRLVSGS